MVGHGYFPANSRVAEIRRGRNPALPCPDRQPNEKRRPLARFAPDADVSAVFFHDAQGNGQARARAFAGFLG